MAAKKHSKRIASDKTTKGRHTQDATSEAVLAETPTPADLAPVEAAEAASAPTAETTRIDTPVPTEGETIVPDPTPPDESAPVKKLSALDAAARVLEEIGQAMNCTALIAAMAAKGYWSSPTGRTPAGILYSAVLRELKTKGDQARFRKTERGKFACGRPCRTGRYRVWFARLRVTGSRIVSGGHVPTGRPRRDVGDPLAKPGSLDVSR